MKNKNPKVIDMGEYKLSKSIHNQEISFYELLFDPVKRKAFYESNDEKYVETDEDREIFEMMSKRRK